MPSVTRGNAAVEFVLVIPFLFALCFLLFEILLLGFHQIQLERLTSTLLRRALLIEGENLHDWRAAAAHFLEKAVPSDCRFEFEAQPLRTVPNAHPVRAQKQLARAELRLFKPAGFKRIELQAVRWEARVL